MHRMSILAFVAALLVTAPSAPQAAGIDGPGSYFMFKSFDTGQPPTAEEDQACDDHFGPLRAPTAALRLHAGAFAFSSDASTGTVVDQKAGFLGIGFGCFAPAANPDPLEVFLYASPPIVGLHTAAGFCAASATVAQPGSPLLNCKAQIRPDAAGNVAGGLATSLSVINPKNAVPGAPTGSVWTTYVVPQSGDLAATSSPGAAPQVPDPSPNLDFYTFRSFAETTAPSSSSCPLSPLATGVRSSALSPTQPRTTDGRLDPGEPLRRSGALTLCLLPSADPARQPAVARVRVLRNGRLVDVTAVGQCQSLPTPAGRALRQQACGLSVQASSAPDVHGGLVTSTGLVPAARPLKPANSHIWTVGLFTEGP